MIAGRVASVAVAMLITVSVAKAAQLEGGYYACISKDLLHEINVARDSHKEWLLKNGCFVTRAGVEVHDLGFDGFAVKKVRVILHDGTPVTLWTAMENVRR